MKKKLLKASILIALIVLPINAAAQARRANAPATAPAATTPARPAAAPNAAPAAAAQQQQPVLQFADAMILIRGALSALQQANQTSNYEVLRALSATGFQQANTTQKLAQTFAPVKNYNLTSILVLEPRFTKLPEINENGMLAMAGFFDNAGFRIAFDMTFALEGEQLKIYDIGVGVNPLPAANAPAAPAAPARTTPPPAPRQ